MNNIYVDELPKKCKDCPCMNNDGFGGYDCNLYYEKHKEILGCDYYSNTIPKDCPLKPLTDRLAEERKSVVLQLRELAKNEFEFIICDECYNTVDKDVYISSSALNEILNQIERSEL